MIVDAPETQWGVDSCAETIRRNVIQQIGGVLSSAQRVRKQTVLDEYYTIQRTAFVHTEYKQTPFSNKNDFYGCRRFVVSVYL